MLVGVRQKGEDFLLLARIKRAGECRAAASLDLLDQRRELVAVTPADEPLIDLMTSLSEFFVLSIVNETPLIVNVPAVTAVAKPALLF